MEGETVSVKMLLFQIGKLWYLKSLSIRSNLKIISTYRLDVDAVVKRLEEENVDDPELNQGTSEDNEETNPVPQVKVAPDGSIIIDEASTLIETTAAKKAKEDLLKSPLVFESANNVSLRIVDLKKLRLT